MSRYWRSPEQLRRAAWESYSKSMHEYNEIRRLWAEYSRRHGDDPLNRMQFMQQNTIKEAIEEQQFQERLTLLHTAMFDMELAWRKKVKGELDGHENQ